MRKYKTGDVVRIITAFEDRLWHRSHTKHVKRHILPAECLKGKLLVVLSPNVVMDARGHNFRVKGEYCEKIY